MAARVGSGGLDAIANSLSSLKADQQAALVREPIVKALRVETPTAAPPLPQPSPPPQSQQSPSSAVVGSAGPDAGQPTPPYTATDAAALLGGQAMGGDADEAELWEVHSEDADVNVQGDDMLAALRHVEAELHERRNASPPTP